MNELSENAKEVNKASLEKDRHVLYNSFMNAPAGIAILKGESHIFEFANVAYEKLVGKKIVLGKTVQDHFPEIEHQGYPEMLDGVFLTGEPFTANEIPLDLNTNGDGVLEKFFINLIVQPLKDEMGITYGILANVIDITAQVEARKQLEASEEFNRSILESNPDCLKVLDLEGRIQFMNFNGLCQMEIDDFETYKNKNWFTFWGNDNQTLVNAAIDKALSGATAQFTALCPTAKGTLKWWDVVVSPIGKPGEKVQHLVSVSRDVTEKKKAEDVIENMAGYLKLATDSANVGTWSFDLASQELEWSGLHKRIWGYDDHRTGLTYENWHTAIVEEDKALAFQRIEESMVNKSIYEVDYRINRADDGAVVWIKSTGKYQYNELGEAVKLTGISIDISQQKMFSEELEKKVKKRTEELALKSEQLEDLNQMLAVKNTELENSNAELKSFTFIASHDLQEPLRKIKTFINRIGETEVFADKTQHYFHRIVAASERMQNLINSLLDFSRNNLVELDVTRCDLNTIVEEVKTDLEINIHEKHVIVEYENLPTINGSHFQLTQLFTNLLDNAIKYSRKEIIPHIKISSARVQGNDVGHPSKDKKKEYYAIKITDNGIGFEKEYANKIFELFQRLHSRDEYSGTGVGLAIVKKIVTNHNGFITAEGNLNTGSTFIIYVPTT